MQSSWCSHLLLAGVVQAQLGAYRGGGRQPEQRRRVAHPQRRQERLFRAICQLWSRAQILQCFRAEGINPERQFVRCFDDVSLCQA
jgi:hypothetical protein